MTIKLTEFSNLTVKEVKENDRVNYYAVKTNPIITAALKALDNLLRFSRFETNLLKRYEISCTTKLLTQESINKALRDKKVRVIKKYNPVFAEVVPVVRSPST